MTLLQVPQPKTKAQIVGDAKRFFEKAHREGEVNAKGLFAHGNAVLERATAVKMFDDLPILAARAIAKPPKDTKRAIKLGVHEVEPNSEEGIARVRRGIANTILGETILFHSADSKIAGRIGKTVLDPDRLGWELEIFKKLIALDLRGTDATDDEYANLLGEKRSLISGISDERLVISPLAFLARIADLAVTHIVDGEERRDISPFVRNGHESRYFREYRTFDEVLAGVSRYAHAARVLYGPAAERLGYPILSGDLYEQAIYVQERHIYDHVRRKLGETQTIELLEETQGKVKNLKTRISKALEAQGFDFEIEVRSVKHPGKIMNKTIKKSSEMCAKAQEGIPESRKEGEKEYFFRNKGLFDVLDFHDIVALRVKIKGKTTGDDYREVKGFVGESSVRALDRAKQTVFNAIEDTFGTRVSTQYEFKEKGNGYKGMHFDLTNTGVCNVEVQVKTEEWHREAEQGGAAHFMYLGGNKGRKGLVAMVWRTCSITKLHQIQ